MWSFFLAQLHGPIKDHGTRDNHDELSNLEMSLNMFTVDYSNIDAFYFTIFQLYF